MNADPKARGSARRFQLSLGLATALGLALWVRAWGIPALARHGWEGHEAEYLAVFLGDWHGSWSTRVVPVLGTGYRILGLVTQREAALVWFSLALGVASIAALVVLIRRLGGPGLLAGLFVVLYGNHAFWSSSAYNVIAPHALLMVALALLTVRGWGSLGISAVLMGAAASSRLEVVVYVLPALLLLRDHRWPRRIAWLAAVAAIYAAGLLAVLEPGAHPEGLLDDLPATIASNASMLVFLAPWDSLALLVPALAVGGLGCWHHRKTGLLLLCMLVASQLTTLAFADSGFRQALTGGVALCGLQALGVDALRTLSKTRIGWRRWTLGAASALVFIHVIAQLVRDTSLISLRYHAPAAPLIGVLEAANPQLANESQIDGCEEVISSPAREPGQASPLDVSFDEGCWYWLQDWQHLRWSSLGVHDRALRMQHTFVMRPLGMRSDPSDPGQPPRQVWLLKARR